MTESIGKALKSYIGDIVRINLSEAETNSYPYAVYDYTASHIQSKDGEVLRIRADVTIHIYAQTLSDAEGLGDQIKSKLAQEMHGETFYAYLRTVNKDCTTGVWDYEMNYTVVQYEDMPAPTPEPSAPAQEEND